MLEISVVHKLQAETGTILKLISYMIGKPFFVDPKIHPKRCKTMKEDLLQKIVFSPFQTFHQHREYLFEDMDYLIPILGPIFSVLSESIICTKDFEEIFTSQNDKISFLNELVEYYTKYHENNFANEEFKLDSFWIIRIMLK